MRGQSGIYKTVADTAQFLAAMRRQPRRVWSFANGGQTPEGLAMVTNLLFAFWLTIHFWVGAMLYRIKLVHILQMYPKSELSYSSKILQNIVAHRQESHLLEQ